MGNTSASPAGTVTPDRVKMALLELDKLARDVLEKPGVPGLAIAVVYQDQVVYAKGFGVREAGKSDSWMRIPYFSSRLCPNRSAQR